MNTPNVWITLAAVAAVTQFAGCSSGPKVKSQAYAKLSAQRTFEYEFPMVWKGIEAALKDKKVTDRDPEDVDANEWNKITQRELTTDWIYSQSRDKYQEYSVNGSPRKKYLQTRYKQNIVAKRVIGGVDVAVKTEEEIERLNGDGTSAGYATADEPDSSRAGEMLDRINNAILSLPP